MREEVIVSGPFDDLRLHDFRFLNEASKRGALRVKLWSDDAVTTATGKAPKFPLAERKYLLEAIRFVERVDVTEKPDTDGRSPGLQPQVFPPLPPIPPVPINPPGIKVLVTGCYDYFHSGHVAFFEECAAFGDLYVGVGSDATIRSLKGPRNPLFPAEERRFIVSCCRHVTLAFINSGAGWLDAEPELKKIRPQIYVVNEDGDKPAKREYCEANGIAYRVLKRVPKQGLPARQSTALRGF